MKEAYSQIIPAVFSCKLKNVGVYCIQNIRNGKRYIGSAARSITQRWRQHKHELRRGTHGNRHLQRAWNRDGEESFSFSVLANCFPDSVVAAEQALMDQFKSWDRSFGYNLARVAGSQLGMRHTPEVRLKISAMLRSYPSSMKGKHHTDGTKELISNSLRGRSLSLTTKEKLSMALKGRSFTPEHRAKISASLVGNSPSLETKSKISAALVGRRQSPETVAKRSAVLRGQKRSPEIRAKMSAAQKAAKKKLTPDQALNLRAASLNWKPTEESRRKHRASMLGHAVSMETRAKIAAALRGRKRPHHVSAMMAGRAAAKARRLASSASTTPANVPRPR